MPKSFPPVVGRNPKVLILGSMPGLVSLQKRQYYGHPQNQFWRLVGAAIDEDLPSLSYPRRLATLRRWGIALWDVLASCNREGSLDADIEDAEPNAISSLLRETGIRVVFLNGGKANAAFRQFISEGLPPKTKHYRLPSSSPAHAGQSFNEKLLAWRHIKDYLEPFSRSVLR